MRKRLLAAARSTIKTIEKGTYDDERCPFCRIADKILDKIKDPSSALLCEYCFLQDAPKDMGCDVPTEKIGRYRYQYLKELELNLIHTN